MDQGSQYGQQMPYGDPSATNPFGAASGMQYMLPRGAQQPLPTSAPAAQLPMGMGRRPVYGSVGMSGAGGPAAGAYGQALGGKFAGVRSGAAPGVPMGAPPAASVSMGVSAAPGGIGAGSMPFDMARMGYGAAGRVPGMGPEFMDTGMGDMGGLKPGRSAYGGEPEMPIFDSSDFPALGGRMSEMVMGGAQAQPRAAVDTRPSFSIQNEDDFPALPGTRDSGEEDADGEAKGPDAQEARGGTILAAMQQSRAHAPVGGFGLQFEASSFSAPAVSSAVADGMDGVRPVGSQPPSQPPASVAVASTAESPLVSDSSSTGLGGSMASGMAGTVSSASVGSTPRPPAKDKYGLMGLLDTICEGNSNLTMLTLGLDLTSLGLNLSSQDNLYSTFSSPWVDQPARVPPEFDIPDCYRMSPPQLKPQLFQKFNLETLFYIFYAMPRDVLQAAAAQELYGRKWRYHKALKQWITRAPRTEPTVTKPGFERGTFLVFDVQRWEKVRKDNFVLIYEELEELRK